MGSVESRHIPSSDNDEIDMSMPWYEERWIEISRDNGCITLNETIKRIIDEAIKMERDRIQRLLKDRLAKIDADPENEDGNAIDRTHLAGMRIALLNAISEIGRI